MGKGNVAVGQWLSNKDRFADFFNGNVFHGKQIVRAEDLEEMDSESNILLNDKIGKKKEYQRYRDIVMRWKGKMNLMIFACENQVKVHYAMPVRNMLYDSLSYTNQIKQLWDTHKGKEQKLTDAEYLSRFRKEDTIYPIITLVWYYGLEKWDGSTDLYGMFSKMNLDKEILKEYVPNYWINLICADDMEDVKKFRTDLQQIFSMLKYRGDKEKLTKYMNEEKEYFGQIDDETFYLIEELLQSERIVKKNVQKENGKGKIDMCKALEDLYQEGIILGIKGLIEGYSEENIPEERLLYKLEEKFGLTKEAAMKYLEEYSVK